MPPRRSSGRVKAAATVSTPAKPARPAAVAAAASAPPSSGGRTLRPRRLSGNYTISSESSEDKSSGSEHQEEEEEDDENETQDSQESHEQDAEGDEDDEADVERPERGFEAGRALRPRGTLAAPEGLKDYVDTNIALANRKRKKRSTVAPKRRVSGRLPPGRACAACRESRRRCDREKPRCSGCVKSNKACIVPDRPVGEAQDEFHDDWVPEPEDEKEMTVRTEIRKNLEETRIKRDRFFKKYAELFENLLSGKNYISKLYEKAEEKARLISEEKAKTESAAEEKANVETDGDVVMNGSTESSKATTNGETKGAVDTSGGSVITNGVKQEDSTNGDSAQPALNGALSDDVVPYKLLDHQPKGCVSLIPLHRSSVADIAAVV